MSTKSAPEPAQEPTVAEVEKMLGAFATDVLQCSMKGVTEWAMTAKIDMRDGEPIVRIQAPAAPIPRLPIKITPEMAAACEAYYANWQRILGEHDDTKLKADCWSAIHAMRAMLEAAPASARETVEYLCENHRFKMSFDSKGRVSCFSNFEKVLDGQWVALVEAADDRHMRLVPAAPAATVPTTLPLAEWVKHTNVPYMTNVQWRELVRLAHAATTPAVEPGSVDVRLASMTESNGRETWIVMLARSPDASALDCLQVYADSIKGRAEYERDRFRHFFGLGPEPDILSYDTAAPGVSPSATVRQPSVAARASELLREHAQMIRYSETNLSGPNIGKMDDEDAIAQVDELERIADQLVAVPAPTVVMPQTQNGVDANAAGPAPAAQGPMARWVYWENSSGGLYVGPKDGKAVAWVQTYQEAIDICKAVNAAPVVAAPEAAMPAHDWQPDGGVLRFESHPGLEDKHVHTTCAKCGARAWFLEFHWELLSKGCPAVAAVAQSTIDAEDYDRKVGIPAAAEIAEQAALVRGALSDLATGRDRPK